MFGEDNAINYTFRMHDARIGRFLSIDPLAQKYPWNSPYAFSENRVVDAVELEGLEMIPTWGLEYQHISVEQATKARFYEAAGLGVGAAIWAIPAISTWAIFNPVAAEETFRSGLEIATNTDMGPTANDFFTYTWKHGAVEIAEELPGAWKRFKGWIGRGFKSASRTANEVRLRSALNTAASEMMELSNKRRSPVVSAVLDQSTGQIFIGKNSDDVIPDLHPILDRRLDEINLRTNGQGNRPDYWNEIPGSHAEIDALNQALHARGANVT